MSEDVIENLTDFQKDALREIGNIGAGNAATAFAQFLDCKIDMTVPSVRILPVSDVPEITGNINEDVVGILLQAMGEAPASLLFILSEESTRHLLGIILDQEVNLSSIGEMEISAIKEIGNILSGSYLSALNKMTGFNLIQSIPGFSYDMAGAIISSSMIPLSQTSDYSLLIETQFLDGGNKIEGYFLLIPHVGSLEKILEALGFEV
ncbi:MAG: chemotaxis protein CheC [Bacillota bacterium]